MDSSRKRTYIIMLVTQTLAGLVNVWSAAFSFTHGQQIGGGVSSLFAVTCAVTAYMTVCHEERQRIGQKIREEVLQEQKADTKLKEEMIAHIEQIKAGGGSLDIGIPVAVKTSKRRDH